MSFIRHEKIYRYDVQGKAEHQFNLPIDHRCDESSAGYSFVGCSPAEPTSASPAVNSFSLYPAAVQFSAANRNCPSIALSQPRGPLQPIPLFFPVVVSQDDPPCPHGGCRTSPPRDPTRGDAGRKQAPNEQKQRRKWGLFRLSHIVSATPVLCPGLPCACVVVWITAPAHADLNLALLQQVGVITRGVLHTSIGGGGRKILHE